MKTIILNGSPRRNWNTAQLLKEAQRGAESAGAEVEYIDLYSLNYSGCRSCLACKRKGIAEPCKCYWKDELTPVLEKIWQADRLIAGAPIYYSEPASGMRSLLERVAFPAMSYNDYSSVFKGRVDADIFLTMNAPMQYYRQVYEGRMQEYFAPLRFLNGQVRIFPVCDTLQVRDYSKYDMAGFSEEHKKAVHDAEFPKLLEQAFKIGAACAPNRETLMAMNEAESIARDPDARRYSDVEEALKALKEE
ncbi:flavodoxin family protein [Succinimonas sp.]|uniref:flavodoxin family protein n=1 Tax=Succinimonas sp. TaxID=1936151 RepID=UPI00386A3E21